MALTGSTTRKYTTASTRTLTLSCEMPSWAGTLIATVCMLTFCIRSATGMIAVSPGRRTCLSCTFPNLNTMPCSYCWITRTDDTGPMNAANATTARRMITAAVMAAHLFLMRLPAAPTRQTVSRFHPQPNQMGNGDSGANHLLVVGCTVSPCLVNDILGRVSARDTDWDGVRLHVVTGKGGTGKTTVAAALALALAAGGRKGLLVEVEGRQGIAQLFDTPPLPYGERRVAVPRP